MRVAREAVEEQLEVLVKQGVLGDLAGEALQLRLRGQLTVDQQVADLDEGRFLGELLNRNTAIAQDAGVTVDVGDGAFAGRGVDEAVVECGESGLGQQIAQRNAVISFGSADDLHVDLATRVFQSCGVVGVGHENPFALCWYGWRTESR